MLRMQSASIICFAAFAVTACGADVAADASRATLVPPPEAAPSATPEATWVPPTLPPLTAGEYAFEVDAAAAAESAALKSCISVLAYLAVTHRHLVGLRVELTQSFPGDVPLYGWASGTTDATGQLADLLNTNCEKFLDAKLIERLIAGN